MFACIYVPNFPVAAALRAEPDLQACAVAILEGKPPLEKIIVVNKKAAALGIAPGMTKAQAELCMELVLLPRSSLLESAAHASLLNCAQSFSPCVEDTACDTVLIDLAGMESLFGSLPGISDAIFDRATEFGLDAHVAVASNPDAALLAARGFSGVTLIPAGQEAVQLGSLPVEVLFSGHMEGHQKKNADSLVEIRLLETLDRWGIRSLRALATLPEVALSERLGQQGLHLQKLARGTVSRTLVPVEEPLVFEEAVELEHPIVLLEPLAFLLNRLLEQLCARLASRALATQELQLTFELNSFYQSEIDFQNSESAIKNHKSELFRRTLRLPLPMLDAKVFLKLLQLDLSAHPPGAPIVKIHLAAEPTRPRSAQGGLFLPPSPEPEKLELTLARIAGLVGEGKAGTVELLDTHRPEGFRMRRFVSEASRTISHETNVGPATPDVAEENRSAVTALRRFRPPLQAKVTLEDGQPVHLVCRKNHVQGQILWKAGPWRFSGDWWEREAWARNEWDIAVQNDALQNGSERAHALITLYRLVHDLLSGEWFVEGVYD